MDFEDMELLDKISHVMYLLGIIDTEVQQKGLTDAAQAVSAATDRVEYLRRYVERWHSGK